jgi:hypothetical protein
VLAGRVEGRAVSPLRLEPGHFYLSREGQVWCCYRVDPSAPEHCQAYCVRASGDQCEYFFLDGRYDLGGSREHCLVCECTPNGGPSPPTDLDKCVRWMRTVYRQNKHAQEWAAAIERRGWERPAAFMGPLEKVHAANVVVRPCHLTCFGVRIDGYEVVKNRHGRTGNFAWAGDPKVQHLIRHGHVVVVTPGDVFGSAAP